ncbi:LysR substrate-binding domain-containing protein [Leptothrix ochracea]
MKNVTFRQLRTFVEVARYLSFARAAETLHLTPPAVTMQIKELELAIDLPVFDRQGRKITLTTAGEYFLVHAKRMLAMLKDADNAMARFRRLETGLLTIGMVSTAKYFVPRLLARFRVEHPGVDVQMQVGNREQLVALLHNGEVDLAIMGRPPKELATRTEPFAAHPLVFIAPPDHPVMQIGHPPLAALEPYPFIVREQASGTRAALEQFYQEQRRDLRIGMEMPSNETIKQAVMAGMGLSFCRCTPWVWSCKAV